jgi:gluconokinase
MDALTLGLDLGTTGCKAVALDASGRVRGTASATYPLLTDASGRAEQEPQALWRAVCQTLQGLSQGLGAQPLTGLALSGAMHSVVPLGQDNEPLANALTWADSRAETALGALRQRADEAALYRHTGCPLETPYHPARLRWLRQARPELFAQTCVFASLKDFLAYRLSGTLATDIGLASTTGLLELRTPRWFDDALALAGVTTAQLPELVTPTEQLGTLTPAAAAETGLRAGLPIFAGSSDGGLANLGSGVIRPGETIVTLGTSGAVRQIADAPQLDEARLTWCYLLDEAHYFAGGAINNGGLTLEWLRRTFYSELPKDQGYGELLADAATADAADLLCLPYLTGERTPHWNAALRGSLFGLGEHHTRADIARAALEGVAFCLADVFDLLGSSELPVQLSGGVTRAPFWAQLITDTLGVKTELNRVADASALGAARLAQVALSGTTLADAARTDRHSADGIHTLLTPDPDNHVRLERKRRRAHALLQATAALSAP